LKDVDWLISGICHAKSGHFVAECCIWSWSWRSGSLSFQTVTKIH